MQHTTTKSRIFLSSPHLSGTEIKYINEAFETNWIAPLGPNVDAFEKEIASYVGVKGSVAVSSGTAAIHLALSLLNVQKGDTVFCSSLTFVASANPILYQCAEPVFIDSEPDTWNMSPLALEEALIDAASALKLPKAVIIVNLYGQSAKMDELVSICKKYDVPIIEDAAESLGAKYKGKASGTFGDFGIYSFNGNKIITTSGGGMLISNNPDALSKARFLATQAKDPAPHYQHSELGYNYRMSNILAGIGRSQLEVLDERINQRRTIFEIYQKELAHLPFVSFLPELNNTFSTRWLTTLTINSEDAEREINRLLTAFESENIEARPVWKPLHLQPLFEKSTFYSHNKQKSISEYLFQTGICLPSGSNMTIEEQIRVIECIKKIFSK
ncbi:Putative pyridoxal phosphate-dependent aminotransferase EpsN [Neobacillus rhizosphaerae]|uniref:Pyridoxal phosphate-dependent aminotransferase EpsN n=1 Tax=Neobacillus rhizosphaerae TaxID=2880965 RepID=A0ABN8KQV4_9BACI|nr:aminotransferase class I/II-fold pyridoxal phosphate-dependent enzyme [Neobacillus rhizosphaerae]CAH2714875.1 Putative pyridoxal phosphate-dependent aminotransferase EpsN [Neobacillus rhizosphaerae]